MHYVWNQARRTVSVPWIQDRSTVTVPRDQDRSTNSVTWNSDRKSDTVRWSQNQCLIKYVNSSTLYGFRSVSSEIVSRIQIVFTRQVLTVIVLCSARLQPTEVPSKAQTTIAEYGAMVAYIDEEYTGVYTGRIRGCIVWRFQCSVSSCGSKGQ